MKHSGALLALLCATACEPEEPHLRAAPVRDEPEPSDEAAPEEAISDRGCTLAAPRALATEPGATLAVAASATTTLVVVEPSEGPFVALAPGDDGPGRREIPRARGESIIALEAAGEHFLLVGRAPCTSGGLATVCLVARSIAADDLSPSMPVNITLPEPMRTRRTFATGSLFYVARSHATAPPGLERFEVADDGTVTTSRRAFGEAVPEGEPIEILGLTADGAGWAVLYRHGATEDRSSAVVLATQLDEHEVGELDEALLCESMAWVGSSLAMIVAFEFARPSWVRLGADGEVLTAPTALPPGDEPPLPFAGVRTARIGGEPGTPTLEIRDAMGDRVGERLSLRGEAAAAARTEDGFVVALLASSGEITLSDVHCP